MTDRAALVSSLVIRIAARGISSQKYDLRNDVLNELQAPDLIRVTGRLWEDGQATARQWEALMKDVRTGLVRRESEDTLARRLGV